MRKVIIILIISILLLIIGLSLSLNVQVLDRIEKGSSLISSLASVITLILALLLFKKYGVERNVLEKNIDRIEKLTEEMRKISLQFDANGYWFQLFPLQKEFYETINEHSKKIKKFHILVNLESVTTLKSITVFATDPFLPQEIAHAVQKIDFIFGVNTRDKKISELSNTVKLRVSPAIKADMQNMQSENDFLLFNSDKSENTITLEEYVNLWRDLAKEIQGWMKKHSNVNTDINIDVK